MVIKMVSEYIRGVEDAIEAMLTLLSTCKSVQEVREKLESLLSEIIQGKTENLIRLLKERR